LVLIPAAFLRDYGEALTRYKSCSKERVTAEKAMNGQLHNQ